MGTNTFLKTFLEPAAGRNVFFDFLNAKNEEKLIDLDFSFVQVKFHFGGLKT